MIIFVVILFSLPVLWLFLLRVLREVTWATLRALVTSKQSYIATESSLENAIYRVMAGLPITSSVYGVSSGGATSTITYDSVEDVYVIRGQGQVGRTGRVNVVELRTGAGSTFNYGLQSGNGGFNLVNSASITGNAFSNGSIVGQGNSLIRGDVISAGPAGLISRITATGSAWANRLDNSTIAGNAHYNEVGGPSTVGGTRFTPATIIDPVPLPIDDAKVEEWKTGIINTGTVIPASACSSGWYIIDTNTIIGNVRIECNLRIRNTGASTIITLTGPIWVMGDIEFLQGPTIRVAPALGRRSVQIIADNPANRLTSSRISIRNSTEFLGSGHPSSFVLLLSQNNSAEMGGTEKAAEIAQSSNGALILYAGRGLIDIGNSITLRSVTGYKIDIGNNSNVIYDTGLASVFFTGGPGGGYVIDRWYQE
jgi:hypothetical protein